MSQENLKFFFPHSARLEFLFQALWFWTGSRVTDVFKLVGSVPRSWPRRMVPKWWERQEAVLTACRCRMVLLFEAGNCGLDHEDTSVGKLMNRWSEIRSSAAQSEQSDQNWILCVSPRLCSCSFLTSPPSVLRLAFLLGPFEGGVDHSVRWFLLRDAQSGDDLQPGTRHHILTRSVFHSSSVQVVTGKLKKIKKQNHLTKTEKEMIKQL